MELLLGLNYSQFVNIMGWDISMLGAKLRVLLSAHFSAPYVETFPSSYEYFSKNNKFSMVQLSYFIYDLWSSKFIEKVTNKAFKHSFLITLSDLT